MQTITAKLRFMRGSHRKARLSANIIKGMPVNEAEGQLTLSPHRTKDALLRLLRSAVANAVHNAKLDPETLYVKDVRVDGGPMQKRWTPRARGSASTIQKKTSHVTIELGVLAEAKAKRFNIVAKKKNKEAAKIAKKAPKAEKPKEEKTATAEKKPKIAKAGAKKVFNRKAV